MQARPTLRRGGTWLLAIAATAALTGGCTGTDREGAPRTGSEVYREVCATCHGRAGQGFVGPSLVDVSARYPNIADQVALVTSGRGRMPAFGGQLSDVEIAKVVEYTRTGLGSEGTPTTFVGPTLSPSTSP